MDLYEKKMRARFQTLDFNQDGVVSEEDFTAMGNNVLAAFGHDAASRHGQAVINGARGLWDGLAEIADTDQDGHVTEDEFVAAAEERLRGNREGFEEVARPWVNAVLDAADTDGDGRLTDEEYERMLQAMGSTADTRRVAATIEHSADGGITVDTVLEDAIAFYTSEQPSHSADSFGRM